MADYFAAYCQLLTSKAQLGYCRGARSLEELLARIKTLWHCTALDDDQLLSAVAHCNSIYLPVEVNLTGNWLPYCYKPAASAIKWLLPDTAPTEPFQEEYIARCKQQLINQIIQPRCHIDNLQKMAATTDAVTPAGFIFHVSRCGSTLLSGCLSELNTTCVFSESPVLTEILLDASLSAVAKMNYVQQLIDLQASVFSDRPHVVIKWNAWDVFQWDLIRGVYPQVPVVFMVRNPIEVLASHHRLAGRHMVGDPLLSGLHTVFSMRPNENILEGRIRVLKGLLRAMLEKLSLLNVAVIDYQQLSLKNIEVVSVMFCLAVNELDRCRIKNRMQYDSKVIDRAFVAGDGKEQYHFATEERIMMNTQLMPLYAQLRQLAYKSVEGAVSVY